MILPFVYNTQTPAEIIPPHMEVRIAPIIAPGGYDADGNEIPPQWGQDFPNRRLIPREMTWGSNGDLTTLTCRYELGAKWGEAQQRAEDIWFEPGSMVRLVDCTAGREWFVGVLGAHGPLIQASPDAEEYRFIAYGPELRLRQKVVSGQWWADPSSDEKIRTGTFEDFINTRAHVYHTDLPVIFNEGGKPNGSWQYWDISDAPLILDLEWTQGAVFQAPDRLTNMGTTKYATRTWSATSALRSLVDWIDNYHVISPVATNWKAISAVLGDTQIGEVNVEGLDLLAAMRAVLAPVGFGFVLTPWSDGNVKPPEDEGSETAGACSYRHQLHVYPLKDPPAWRRPWFAPAGNTVTHAYGRAAEIQRLHFMRDNHNVTNDVTVLGARKQVQVQLSYSRDITDLWPCWDTTTYDLDDHANTTDVVDPLDIGVDGTPAGATYCFSEASLKAFMQRYNPRGDEFHAYMHVFRSFCWNEDATLSDYAQSGGEAQLPDLSTYGIGDGTNYARIPRPIGPALEYKDATKTAKKPATVTLTVGSAVVDITGQVRIWPDKAGFTITAPFLTLSEEDGDVKEWMPFAKCQDAGDELRATGFLTLLHRLLHTDYEGTTMTIAIYGTIQDDRCVRGHSARASKGSWPMLAHRVVRDPNYQKRTVHAYREIGASYDGADNSVQAALHALKVRDALEDEMGHGSIMIPFLTRAYPPGVGIPETRGRVVSFYVDGGRRLSCPTVRAVKFTFGQANTTELLLDSRVLQVSG